ncbi:MAG: DNA-binding domain-containing protein [Thermomonas sp.]
MSAARSTDSPLAQLQRQFIAHLRGNTDESLHQAVDVGRLRATTGLRIYAHAYGARLREALENDHAVLAAYLGDELWESLCKGYIETHPSRVRSLRDFGNALPAYLGEMEPFRGHPQLAELARFERLLLDSFDAADDPRADWVQLQAIPPERWPALRVRVHRSVRVHRARHGSVAIWQAIKAEQEPPTYAGIEDAVDWVLWRDADGIGRFRSLEHDSAAAFGCCRHSGSFAELCELMAITHPIEEVPARVLGCLQDWCNAGWIAAWDTRPVS